MNNFCCIEGRSTMNQEELIERTHKCFKSLNALYNELKNMNDEEAIAKFISLLEEISILENGEDKN